ncbi:MAG TPA: efflux RND transporter periplasmic adaptor subunit [Xanthobacteraceae bacterium]|nr:efflux RND transporter periplasmic adaptor subunit [Xanthobacteraceae bacterium]
MQTGRRTNARLVGGVVALAAALAACGQDNRYVAPPPPKVTVALPVQQPVTRYLEATGNAAAVSSTNLVARVQGFLQSIDYKDGDLVKQGTTLFTIEPEPYKLRLQQAQAAEGGARAALKQAEAEYERQTDLAGRQVASKAALENATANRDSALARLKQAEVDTKQAELNLSYTQVRAPFDGIVTARLVSLGELVGANGPTQLATIVETDPIYVNFNISERDVLQIRAEIRRLGITKEELRAVPIEVGLQTDKGYPHQGTLDYVSPKIDPSTGTLAVRAVLKNPDGVLVPGYFVRVRVAADEENSLLVPDAALGSDQGGRYVLVVNKDNVVEQRKVTTGPRVGELRAIDSGLKADDRVVISGILRAIPGQKVDPQMQTVAAAPAVGSK